jgi:stage II sporulation protein E
MYETTFNAISVLQTKGEILKEDLEDTCCENKLLLSEGLNFSYEIYKVNQDWQQRMNENKLHISKQLKEVSNALNKMKNEMRETVVTVEKEDAKYSLEIGIAKKKKNNSIISGDSTTVIKLKDGKVLVGLSDGMGSGEIAARNSKKVMLTLEKFLNTGFDKETAVKLLNSYLLIGKEEENFATLDVAIFDQNTCEVDFVKVSACPTLVKGNNKIKEITSMSLPIGIINDIDIDLKSEKLSKGDFFVMTTDGVTDVSSKLPDERGISYLLKEIKTEDSQRLADIILQEMLDATYGIARDDMTVMVVKVV